MKIKDGFVLRSVMGEHVIVAEGTALIDFNKIFSLNGSAALLWQRVEGREFCVEDLADILVGEYGINADRARKDAGKIAGEWAENGLVEGTVC